MIDPPDFSKIRDVVLSGDEDPIDAEGLNVSTGIVLLEGDGRLWLFEPLNHFGGYEHTFPKGRVESLTYQQNAHKELFEETGLLGEITGIIGDFVGDTTVTRYYLGVPAGGEPTCGNETQAVKLVSF